MNSHFVSIHIVNASLPMCVHVHHVLSRSESMSMRLKMGCGSLLGSHFMPRANFIIDCKIFLSSIKMLQTDDVVATANTISNYKTFTYQELRKLNTVHNAHVAYHGKVS